MNELKEKVKKAYDKLQEKKERYSKMMVVEKPNYKTPMTIDGINLHVANMQVLLEAADMLSNKKLMREKTYQLLGINPPSDALEYKNIPIETWFEDIKIRLSVIEKDTLKKEINQLEKEFQILLPEIGEENKLKELLERMDKI